MNEHVTGEQLSMLIDGELSLVAERAVRTHLFGCPQCASLHDRLIEVTAGLRPLPALSWSGHSSRAVMERIEPRPRHALAFVLAGVLLVAALLAVLSSPLVEAGALVGQSVLSSFASLAPGSAVTATHVLLVLVVVALLFPVISIRLARWR